MGLNERRKIKELQEMTLPGRDKENEEMSGKGIPHEVEWESTPARVVGVDRPDGAAGGVPAAAPITVVGRAGAAATPAAVVQRNCRRDRPAARRPHEQLEMNGCVT